MLSGDLCHDPSPEGYERVRDMLGDWVDRTLVVPGNHDNREMVRAAFGRPGAGSDAVCFRSELRRWQLIGLDTVAPGEGHGWLNDAQLDQLDAWLAIELALPSLLFLHQPPATLGSPWLDPMLLRNPEQLASRPPPAAGSAPCSAATPISSRWNRWRG